MQPWGCRKHPDVEGHACGVCLRMVQPEVATFPSDNEGLGCSEACWDSRRQHTHEHKHSLHARTHTHETHKRRHEDRRSGTGMTLHLLPHTELHTPHRNHTRNMACAGSHTLCRGRTHQCSVGLAPPALLQLSDLGKCQVRGFG